MSILEMINKPSDLKAIKKELFNQLAEEIRQLIIDTVSKNGGHLAPSLGTVELTLALHYVYDAPKDKILWDVGHQAYAHKILTGRREAFKTLRTHGGLSGFPKIQESEYDAFGVGHSSTSISAALGMACARDLNKEEHKVIAVIGDGSMTGGMAFEGLQNAGHIGTDLLVILNDNEMFISHRVGALAGYFAKLLTMGTVKSMEAKVERFFKRIHFHGSDFLRVAKRFKVLLFPGMLFEEMGFAYLGPVDGHNTKELIEILSNVKKIKGPVLLHVITKKGKGYPPAENEPTKFHGIGKFDVVSGSSENTSSVPSYTQVFSDTLLKLAREDEKIITVTAAMPEGTGLDAFQSEFKERYFDVGIAEGHALTFAAGLAANGMKPVCAIYSTFLQRGLDQIIHDIALQELPVVIAIDRAGIVGEDGATHQGAFDISFLRFVPNLIIMAPSDENELQHMLKTALASGKPCAIRYPRGSGVGVKLDEHIKPLAIGKADFRLEGKDLCILALGNTVYPAIEASKLLEQKGISAGVVNLRFAKPLDETIIRNIAAKVKHLITVEENAVIGGIGSAVSEMLSNDGVKVLHIGFPDNFVEHGSQKQLRDKYGLSAQKIAAQAQSWFKKHNIEAANEEKKANR